ncbi:hypothetical protein E6C60_1568 [Paenibacillus algicola]|uniref:Uncharacterized protein n=1 Tax=Paenibacillus algicola TaxID=2565926 RepID=A0A4V1G3T2_9BACL|nr:hypothetical protein E6C60_1568 [Paenibacillus algicola]
MREIVGKAYTELGRELKEAQKAKDVLINAYSRFIGRCLTSLHN